jgi:hypothetical protein
MPSRWTTSDPTWAAMDPYQRAAAMALMEANTGKNQGSDARDVVSAMVNRARKGGEDLGAHVSKSIYQPTFEPGQHARLPSIVSHPEFGALTQFARDRWTGAAPDTVGGNTHFLAPESTMWSLYKSNPSKYPISHWGAWAGYGRNPDLPTEYTNPDKSPVFRDHSHAFVAPEGRYEYTQPPDAMDNVSYGTNEPAPSSPFVPTPSSAPSPSPGPSPSASPDIAGLLVGLGKGTQTAQATPASPFAATPPAQAAKPDDGGHAAAVQAAQKVAGDWYARHKQQSPIFATGAA